MAEGGHAPWSGLKPSRARVQVERTSARPDFNNNQPQQQHQQLPSSSSLRGLEWAPSWAAAAASSSWTYATDVEAMSQHNMWGATMARPKSPRSWTRSVSGTPAGLHRSGASGRGAAGDGTGSQEPSRPGWKRSRVGQQSAPPAFRQQPCSETKMDEEMRIMESRITRTILQGHLADELLAMAGEVRSHVTGADGDDFAESKKGTPQLKRKRSGFPDSDSFQGDCGWIHPLKLLIRKGLTMSDVGDLGRIIIPKKDAEKSGGPFPQIDTKEGTMLEMEDYTASKRWYFRFKYWINNKSRMYVLENTGEFIMYHSLKEHDMFLVYEDGCKKLVVCGQKKTEHLDSVLELLKGSILESSATNNCASKRTFSCIDNLAHF